MHVFLELVDFLVLILFELVFNYAEVDVVLHLCEVIRVELVVGWCENRLRKGLLLHLEQDFVTLWHILYHRDLVFDIFLSLLLLRALCLLCVFFFGGVGVLLGFVCAVLLRYKLLVLLELLQLHRLRGGVHFADLPKFINAHLVVRRVL